MMDVALVYRVRMLAAEVVKRITKLEPLQRSSGFTWRVKRLKLQQQLESSAMFQQYYHLALRPALEAADERRTSLSEVAHDVALMSIRRNDNDHFFMRGSLSKEVGEILSCITPGLQKMAKMECFVLQTFLWAKTAAPASIVPRHLAVECTVASARGICESI